jgi:acyl transferase domain-containing protein/acyl carrier protein
MSSRDSASNISIAIIGMAFRFPEASDPEQFWELMSNGVDAISNVTHNRSPVYSARAPRATAPGREIGFRGGFIADIDAFDAEFFGISSRQARQMDPQQRLLLETTWEAFEDAGTVPAALAGSRTGVFVGHLASDYWELLLSAQDPDIYSVLGSAARSALAGRISYAFDLRGPSVALDTGCSSSLVAVHQACQSLRLGESRMAVAAGVSLILKAESTAAYTGASMLAPDGRCKFGDSRADGFVRSEGVGVVVLKPLADALADGDPVRAVIMGSATHNHGQSGGYFAVPAESSQADLLVSAYEQAGIDPAAVDYLEAHGTGTSVGDPAEVGAVIKVLGDGRSPDRPLLLGSVKANIGHCEGAAGVAGLIKTVLCLEHRAVPPSLHISTLNPKIDWDSAPVTLCRELSPLTDRGRPVIAGVTSMGIAGTNVHVVVSEHVVPSGAPDGDPATPDGMPYLLPVSARDPDSLAALSGRYADWLRSAGASQLSPADICRSAGERRSHHERRLAVAGVSAAEMSDSLAEYAAGGLADGAAWSNEIPDRPRVAFVFPGQGSQWIGMGRELLNSSPAFAAELRACDAAIAREAGWSLLYQLHSDTPDHDAPQTVQPMIWAIEVSLAALWNSWGVAPDWVIGHSMGEVAAAYVAGALTLDDAAAVICRRSELAGTLRGRGGMASVGLSEDDTRAKIGGYQGRLAVAAVNGPARTVVSGDLAALDSLGRSLIQRNVFFRRINVDYASHSPQIDPIIGELRERLADINPRNGHTPMYSTLCQRPVDGTGLDADYWAGNLREKVSFASGIADIAQQQTIFLEMSPDPALLGAIRECLQEAGHGIALGSLRRDEPERATMLASAARVYSAGHSLQWREINGPCRTFVRLPRYPWRRDRFWFDQPSANEPGLHKPVPSPGTKRQPAPHPLIGAKLRGDVASGLIEWENNLDLTVNSYLTDHQVQGVSILPGTTGIEIAVAVAAEIFPGRTVLIRDMEYHNPLLLGNRTQRLRVRLSAVRDSGWRIEVFSRLDEDDDWIVWATGRLAPPALAAGRGANGQLDRIRRRCTEQLNGTEFYRRFAVSGNEWGSGFQNVRQIWRADGEALAQVRSSAASASAEYHFHPAVLDACVQALAATMPGEGADTTPFVLAGIDCVRVHRRLETEIFSHAVQRSAQDPNSYTGDVRVYDASGELIAEMLGLRLRLLVPKGVAAPDLPTRIPAADWIYELCWRVCSAKPQEPQEPPAAGRWLLLADRIGVSLDLARRLRAVGRAVTLVVPGDDFAKLGPACYQVRPTSEYDFSRVLNEGLAESDDTQWAAIVHLWSLNSPAAPLITSAAVRDSGVEGVRSAIGLVQALSREQHPAVQTVRLVTRGAQSITEHDTVSPLQASMWGLGRTIMLEHPELSCSLVDIDPATAEASGLFAELVAHDEENQVALRGSARYVARLARAARGEGRPGSARIRGDVTYLITGGLGDLGLRLAQWLADRGARHLLLVSRSVSPERYDHIRALLGDGIRVTCEACDVADGDKLAGLISAYEESGAPEIAGVVHAAGVARFEPVADLDDLGLEDILRPKVAGSWNLHLILGDRALDFFVLFSSAASMIGSPRLGGYAAANAFLDAFGEYRRRAGQTAMCVNWGFWKSLGMIAREESRGGRPLTPRGVQPLTSDDGEAILDELLSGDAGHAIVLPVDWIAWRKAYQAAAATPVFAEIFADNADPAATTHPADALRVTGPPEPLPRSEIEVAVKRCVAQVLDTPSSRVDSRKRLSSLGLDSLMAVEVCHLLQGQHGLTVPLVQLLGTSTIDDVVAALTGPMG